jgi:hypothetical protein
MCVHLKLIFTLLNPCLPFIKLSSKIFDLKVKGQGQTVIMMARETLSHHKTITNQISLTYLKRQKLIAQTQTHRKYQLFDLKVKGQTEVTALSTSTAGLRLDYLQPDSPSCLFLHQNRRPLYFEVSLPALMLTLAS